jgi:hypothetical protein
MLRQSSDLKCFELFLSLDSACIAAIRWCLMLLFGSSQYAYYASAPNPRMLTLFGGANVISNPLEVEAKPPPPPFG